MAALSFSWYAAIAALLGGARMRVVYGRARRWIEGFAGLVFVGFGLRIMVAR